MLTLNKNLVLALQTVEILARSENAVRTQDIAGKLGASQAFLEQIVRKLRLGGIVTAVRGPGGGYKINETKPVSALDVANALGYEIDNSNTGTVGGLVSSIVSAYATIILSTGNNAVMGHSEKSVEETL